jgi:methionyl-tRNA formyltransferase
VPALERLRVGPHTLVAVVTQPDRPRGRGRRTTPSPVARAARAAGLRVLQPERVGDPEVVAELRDTGADLGVVVAYGQFLPRRVRESPRLGYCINAHASLLPRHRGAAPIAHALLCGECETGVSIMRVEREMDAGPVCAVSRTPIAPGETAGELEARLAGMAADLLVSAVDAIARGGAVWTPQDPSRATLAPKLGREDAIVDWRRPASELERLVRALSPRPGATTRLAGEPLRILAAQAVPGAVDRPPGGVRIASPKEALVATGDGWLALRVVQRAGGRPVPLEAFLAGRGLADGARLGA